MNERGKLRHQQRGVGRFKDEIAAEHRHIGRALLPAVAHFAGQVRRRVRIDLDRLGGLEPSHGEAGRRGQEHEIARLDRHRIGAIDRQAAASLGHRAEPRMSEIAIAHRPASGAADRFRKHRARAQQRDKIGQGISHMDYLT